MDLEEHIARLIDPELWDHDPQPCTYDDWHRGESIRAARRVIDWHRGESIRAARRVIDGLHLDIISSHHSLDGLRHRYDLSGHFREDA